jgi:hypothetical protein
MLKSANDDTAALSLDTSFVSRPVNTHIFAPFLIARLQEHPNVQERTLEYKITLQNVGENGIRTVPVNLTWTEAMIPAVPLAAQREYITEAAAYGLAFAILAHFTTAILVDVADRGDRFDHIVVENDIRCGIEVSGSQTVEKSMLRDRHMQKIRQLLENPQKWGGYVAIVGFARREVILSYHHAREARGV